VRVVVRGQGRVGQRRRTAAAAALAGEFGKLFDCDLSAASSDVRYAVERINVDACDMRMFVRTVLDELDARRAASPSNWDGERLYVVGSLRDVGG